MYIVIIPKLSSKEKHDANELGITYDEYRELKLAEKPEKYRFWVDDRLADFVLSDGVNITNATGAGIEM